MTKFTPFDVFGHVRGVSTYFPQSLSLLNSSGLNLVYLYRDFALSYRQKNIVVTTEILFANYLITELITVNFSDFFQNLPSNEHITNFYEHKFLDSHDCETCRVFIVEFSAAIRQSDFVKELWEIDIGQVSIYSPKYIGITIRASCVIIIFLFIKSSLICLSQKNVMCHYFATLTLLKWHIITISEQIFFLCRNIIFSYYKCNLNLKNVLFWTEYCIMNFTCDINFPFFCPREKMPGKRKWSEEILHNESCGQKMEFSSRDFPFRFH